MTNRWAASLMVVLFSCSSETGVEVTRFNLAAATKRAIAASVCDGAEISFFTPLPPFNGWGFFAWPSKTVAALASIESCEAGVTTCEAYLACEGVDADEPCQPGTPGRCIDKHTAESCAERVSTMDLWNVAYMRRDACADVWDENVLCAYDVVADPDAPWLDACIAGACSEKSGCDGDVFWSCDGGGRDAFDCSLFDMTCSGVGCVSKVEAAGEPVATCQSDHVFEIHGSWTPTWRFDCTSLDPAFTCQPNADMPKYSCRASPSAVECQDDDARCKGDVAQVCVGGKWFSFDCSTFLGATCREKAYGDERYAYCFSQAWFDYVAAQAASTGTAKTQP